MARRIRWQIVIAALSMLLIGGLLGSLAISRTTSVSNPLAGGTYVEAVIGAPQQPIPLLNDPLGDPVGRALGALLFDGLMRIGADGLLEPALAAAYQTDASGEVYTFSLRRDLTWHDGAPVTANDVVFTLRALQELDAPGDPATARLWQDVLVDRIDDYTVRATLTAPFAPFLSLARTPILPAHLLAGSDPATWAGSAYARQLVGTGPYRLVELREDGATLAANERYFGGRPYLDMIELRFIATPEAAAAALARGDVTALGERGGSGLAPLDLPGSLSLRSAPLDEYAILSFNLRQAPLDEPTLRRALAYALDRDALIESALAGLVDPFDSPILPGWWAYNPDARWYAPDRGIAERVLSELGYEVGISGVRQREGRPLALELIVDGEPRRLAAAQEIARQWALVGVAVEVRQLDAPELLRRLQAHDFTLALHSWGRLGPDPDPFALWHSSQAERGLNYAGLADAEIDAALEGGRVEGELAARSADYSAFQQRWIELAPSIPLYQLRYYFAADTQLGGLGFGDPDDALAMHLFGAEDRYRLVARWFTNSYREIEGDLR